MQQETTRGIGELLEERAWVRTLARRLVADEAAAADLEQETWLAALAHPPEATASARAWLGTVLRNAWRDAARSADRRNGRERASARRDHAPSTADTVARAETHRRVVTAVMELPPPFRDTVLLRWFDDLPPREIAARMSVPVTTVHSRLQRAHARLRSDLIGDEPERRRGAILVLASLGREPATPTVARKLTAVTCALGVFGLLAYLWASDAGQAGGVSDVGGLELSRNVVATDDPAPRDPALASGLVRMVTSTRAAARARSSVAQQENVGDPVLGADAPETPQVPAPYLDVTIVDDASGSPVAAARLAFTIVNGSFSGPGSERVGPGRFQVVPPERSPFGGDAKVTGLRATAAGYLPAAASLPSLADRSGAVPFRIELSRGGRVTVRVVDDNGAPASGATAYVGRRSAATDVSGAAVLATLPWDEPLHIQVLHDGVFARAETVRLTRAAPVSEVTVRLRVQKSLRVTVMSSDGEPVFDASVWVTAPDALGRPRSAAPIALTDEGGRVTLSGIAVGEYRVVARAAGHAAGRLDGIWLDQDLRAVTVRLRPGGQRWLAGRVVDLQGDAVAGVRISHGSGHVATTGRDGRFRLDGLTERDDARGLSVFADRAPFSNLRVTKKGYIEDDSLPVRFDVESTIVLLDSTTVEGFCPVAMDGATDVRILFYPDRATHRRPWGDGRWGFTKRASRAFRIADFPRAPGELRISATLPDGGAVVATAMIASDALGKRTNVGILAVTRLARVTGQVVDQYGHRVRLRAPLVLDPRYGEARGRGTVFIINGEIGGHVSAGDYDVDTFAPGYLTRGPRPLSLRVDRVTDVQLVVVKAGWLRVDVRKRGAPVADARVSISYEGSHRAAFEHRARSLARSPFPVTRIDATGTEDEALTDGRGLHTFRPLPPGNYTISVDGMPHEEVELTDGAKRHVVVDTAESAPR